MSELFVSPRLIDLVLVFTVMEGAFLLFVRGRLRGTAGRPVEIVLMLLPGVFLMLAIRTALSGAAWPWVPAALVAALVAHVADIRERWLR